MMIQNLKDQLDSKGLTDLVVSGDDKEHVLGVYPVQLSKVEHQGRHILKSLCIVSRCYENNGHIT